jgi:hypothetical protein
VAGSQPGAFQPSCIFGKPIAGRDHECMLSRRGAVDGLINRRARINRPAVAPHALIERLASVAVGLADQRLALAPLFRRALGENVRHRPRLRKLFRERLAVAAGQRHVMVLPGHGPHKSAPRGSAQSPYMSGPGDLGPYSPSRLVGQAYHRERLIEERRELMEQWAAFCMAA